MDTYFDRLQPSTLSFIAECAFPESLIALSNLSPTLDTLLLEQRFKHFSARNELIVEDVACHPLATRLALHVNKIANVPSWKVMLDPNTLLAACKRLTNLKELVLTSHSFYPLRLIDELFIRALLNQQPGIERLTFINSAIRDANLSKGLKKLKVGNYREGAVEALRGRFTPQYRVQTVPQEVLSILTEFLPPQDYPTLGAIFPSLDSILLNKALKSYLSHPSNQRSFGVVMDDAAAEFPLADRLELIVEPSQEKYFRSVQFDDLINLIYELPNLKYLTIISSNFHCDPNLFRHLVQTNPEMVEIVVKKADFSNFELCEMLTTFRHLEVLRVYCEDESTFVNPKTANLLLNHPTLRRLEFPAVRSGDLSDEAALALTRSRLDDIPGLGPVKKRALLTHFGSLAQIAEASPEALTQVKGITPALADEIRRWLNR